METPLQITFRNMAPSESIEKRIGKKVEKLKLLYNRLLSCRVLIEAPHRHHYKGRCYTVRIDLMVPGGELVIRKTPNRLETKKLVVQKSWRPNCASVTSRASRRRAKTSMSRFETPSTLREGSCKTTRAAGAWRLNCTSLVPMVALSRCFQKSDTAFSKHLMTERYTFMAAACWIRVSNDWTSE